MTIRTIAQFIESIIEERIDSMEQNFGHITHPPTIGDMYEGMTEEVLHRIVFSEFDIRIVRGFIKFSDGRISSEQDRMIVVGDGIRIPGTDRFEYLADKVIATIEVKKTLTKDILSNAISKIKSLDEMLESTTGSSAAFADSYHSLLRESAPSSQEIKNLPFERRLFGQALWQLPRV